MTQRITIFTGYTCNNKCRFCVAGHKRHLGVQSTNEILNSLQVGRNNGANYVDFIGGESTIRKDIFNLVSTAKKMGYTIIKTTTNGRMYSYKEFSQKIVNAGLTGCIFSIHGPNSNIHDNLTQVPGSFNQVLQGIKNLQALKIKDIETNTIIVKQNYKFLPNMVKIFSSMKVRYSGLIFPDPDPSGLAYTYFDDLVPTYYEVAPFLNNAIKIGNKLGITRVTTQYVPICFIQGFEKNIGEFFYEPDTEHHAIDFIDNDVIKNRQIVGKVKGQQCINCKFDNVCEGVWKQYAKKKGVKELIPIKGNKIKNKNQLYELYF